MPRPLITKQLENQRSCEESAFADTFGGAWTDLWPEASKSFENQDVFLHANPALSFWNSGVINMHRGFASKAGRVAMAPAVGFEPTTNRLTADRSTTELRWILCRRGGAKACPSVRRSQGRFSIQRPAR